MRALCLMLLLGSASWLIAAPIPKSLRNAISNDRATLIGTWSLVIISTETGPINMDQCPDLRVLDETGTAAHAVGNIPEPNCTIKLQPADNIKSLDWTFYDSGDPVVYKCVYELTESKLIIVRKLNNKDDRPTSCEAGLKSCVFYEFERNK